MAIKIINRPAVNEAFEFGGIESWKFIRTNLKTRGKYCVRCEITFENGKTKIKQDGGHVSKSECQQAYEMMVIRLTNHSFVYFDKITLQEFYDYWLYYYMIDEQKITHSTFQSYKNIIYNYIIPYLDVKYLSDIKMSNIYDFIIRLPSRPLQENTIAVFFSSLKFAFNRNYISHNPMTILKKNIPLIENETKNNNLDIASGFLLLNTCRTQYPRIYLPMLLAIFTGTRISETIAIKYSQINFIDQTISITHQLGRDFIFEDEEENGLVLSRPLDTKTPKSVRKIFIPDILMEELLLARKRYEINKESIPGFHDKGFVWCKENGEPYNRRSYEPEFGMLRKQLGLEHWKWHSFRHLYGSLLIHSNVSLKAVSSAMGHAHTDITNTVYVEHNMIIAGSTKKAHNYFDSLLPNVETFNCAAPTKKLIDFLLEQNH